MTWTHRKMHMAHAECLMWLVCNWSSDLSGGSVYQVRLVLDCTNVMAVIRIRVLHNTCHHFDVRLS